ncbi:hypothetical protein [Candidatus Chlorohelix allophototropha]|uniref:hypothetical protein n=1 Tax=Candidatus Chlorohelix allophototropha TaxID=3003348 RepID=UPI003CE45CCD
MASGKELYSNIIAQTAQTTGFIVSTLSPDGKLLATGHWDGSIKVWEIVGL